MTLNGVNGAGAKNPPSLKELQEMRAAAKTPDQVKVADEALKKYYEAHPDEKKGTELEHSDAQPLTEEGQAQKDKALADKNAEIANAKKASQAQTQAQNQEPTNQGYVLNEVVVTGTKTETKGNADGTAAKPTPKMSDKEFDQLENEFIAADKEYWQLRREELTLEQADKTASNQELLNEVKQKINDAENKYKELEAKYYEQYMIRRDEDAKAAAEEKVLLDTGSMEIRPDYDKERDVKVDAKIAQKEQIDEQEKYKDKKNVKEEFGSKLTDAQFDKLENDYKAAEKELKAARKENKKLKFDKDNYDPDFYKKKQAAGKKEQDANIKLQKLKAEYEKEKVRRSSKATRGIQKAAKHNVENMQNVLDTQRVFLTKDEEEAAIKENPELKGKTEVLKNKDINNLVAFASYAEYKIAEAEKTGDPETIQAAKDKYEGFTKMFGKTEDGQFDINKINTREVQNSLVDLSGFDERFNADEIKVMSDTFGVSKSSLKHTVKKFGFGTENLVGQKFKAAGIAAAATALGSLLSTQHSHKSAESTATAQGETVQGNIDWTSPDGTSFHKSYEATGGTAIATARVEACAKIPWLRRVGGPVLAGVSAFLLTKEQTEDAFNGATVDAVLDNLNLVKGKDNKAIVANIQDMEITGDPSKDKKIKAAVLATAIGQDTTKANTEELLAAYEYLKDTKENIGKIQDELDRPEPTTTTVTVTVTTPPAPDPDPEPPCYGTEEVTTRTQVPVIKYGGPWHYAQLYVNPDGSKLSEKDRNAVLQAIKSGENAIQNARDENGKLTGRSLAREITLPNGKSVKLADDAAERAAKMQGKAGGKTDRKYGTAQYGSKFYVTDCENPKKRIGGPFNSRAEMGEWLKKNGYQQ